MPSPKLAVPEQGIYHKVHAGETIWRIAKMYNVSVDDIVSSNKIPNVAHIEKNQLLFIPGTRIEKDITLEKETSKIGEFSWPLRGKIISYFGDQKDTWVNNNGIDIQTDIGEKVVASRDGRVIFADYLNGYGYTVILDHADNFFTVYSQNSIVLVKLDDMVSKGMPIAQVGQNANKSYLHFEIRKNQTPTNPLYYLP